MQLIMISSLACSSCIIMNNIVNDIVEKYKIDIKHIDYDFEYDSIKFDNIKMLPVFIVTKDDKEVSRLVGEKSQKEFINFLEGAKLI